MPEQPRIASDAPLSPANCCRRARSGAGGRDGHSRRCAARAPHRLEGEGSHRLRERGGPDGRDAHPRRHPAPLPHARDPRRGDGPRDRAGALRPGLVFVVDPLDGTTNFLHGYPEYAVSIGVLVDGELAAGVVLNVADGRDASRRPPGGGALLNGAPIRCRRSTIRSARSSARAFRSRATRRSTPYVAQLARVMAGRRGRPPRGRRGPRSRERRVRPVRGVLGDARSRRGTSRPASLIVREAGGIGDDARPGAECPVARTSVVAGSAAMHAWLLRDGRGG